MIEKLYNNPELKKCSIDTTFKIIGQTWTVLILRDMFRNQTHFNHILQNIEGLTSRVLAQRMKTLQMLGIVEKKLSLDLQFMLNIDLLIREELEPILLAAAIYSMGFMPGVVFKDKKSRSIEEFLR